MQIGDGSDLPNFSDFSRALRDARDLSGGFAADLKTASQQMREMDGETRRLSRSLGSSLRVAFDKAIFGGAKFGDVLRGLANNVLGNTLDAALRPIQNAIGAGVGGAVGSFTGAIQSALGFANGGVFSSGRVRAFAKGGVIDGPTIFPLRGSTGLMGEAGPEAIMPLTRGADGRLGVAATGTGRAGANIVVNISTPDPATFRRSSGQISAQIARAVARGERQL